MSEHFAPDSGGSGQEGERKVSLGEAGTEQTQIRSAVPLKAARRNLDT